MTIYTVAELNLLLTNQTNILPDGVINQHTRAYKISEHRKGNAESVTPGTIKQLAEARQNGQVTCPFCNLTGMRHVMQAYHFDFCKSNPNAEPIQPLKKKKAVWSSEAREAMSQLMLESRKPGSPVLEKVGAANRGKKRTQEQVNAIRLRQTGHKQSPETVEKRRISLLGKQQAPKPRVSCVHCHKESGVSGLFYKYHGDNCKQNLKG